MIRRGRRETQIADVLDRLQICLPQERADAKLAESVDIVIDLQSTLPKSKETMALKPWMGGER